MLEVHAPHEATHTWRDFFIHIATIVVGLIIAVGLEQTVEAVHRHHEAAALREDLHAETEQILADAQRADKAMDYELQWLAGRIAQVRVAAWDGKPVAAEEANQMPYFASPDIPIWRSAKAGGLTPLLSKGEINAFAEVEYVQTHVESMSDDAGKAVANQRSFVEKFPKLSNGAPDFTKASREDLQTYLGLLTANEVALNNYQKWARVLIGAELAVRDGKTKLEDIYALERAQAKARTTPTGFSSSQFSSQ
jgi:hypothetical protein